MPLARHTSCRRYTGTEPALRRRQAALLLLALATLPLLAGCAGSGRPAANPGTVANAAPPAAAGAAAEQPLAARTPAPAVEVQGARSSAPQGPAQGAAQNKAPEPAQGRVLEQARRETFSPGDIDEIGQRFYVYGNALPARYTVDWYRIRFTSLDRDGTPLPLVAQVFVPRAAGQELPVYDFGPGTTGLKDECAPSHEEPTERNWGDFEAHLLSYASQGYVAIMPDYASNPATGLQYYYVAEMHARTMLDAARAALRFTQQQPAGAGGAKAANAIFLAGYSQGGHAAFAARDAAAQYAPELHIKGAMGYGPRGEVRTMLEEAPYLAPYLFYSYAKYYGEDKVPLETLLVPTITRTLEADVTTKCIDEVPAYYGDYTPWIYQPALDDAVDRHQVAQKFPGLEQLLDANDAGRGQSDVPVLILQGLADTLVTPQTQRAFVRKLCATGATVTYNTYEGIPHVLTRQVSYRDTLAWMAAILDGGTPRSDCAAIRS